MACSSPAHPLIRTLRRITLVGRGALFVLGGLFLVCVIFGAFSIFSVRKSSERVTDWALRSAQVAAERLSYHLSHEQDGVRHIARWPGIASSLELLQAGQTSVAPPWITLHYLASDEHDFGDCVFVTDRKGTVLWTKPPGLGLLGKNVAGETEVRAALEHGSTTTSGVIGNGLWSEPHILTVTSIQNSRQEIIGVVGNIIGADRLKGGELFRELQGLIKEIAPRETYVVDERGFVITSTNRHRVFSHIRDQSLLARVRQRQTTFSVLDGGVVQVVQPLPLVRWSLVLEQASEDIYRDAYRLGRNLAILGLVLTALASLVWFPLTYSFISPVRGLQNEAERIASGDLSHPISSDGHDEIAMLAASLENMRGQLQGQQARVQAQVTELAELNRLKSEFIANLSHEFRTPIHIMRGYTDLVREGAFGDVPAKLREPMDAIARQYEWLWQIFESCLRLARIDEGKERVYLTDFDLSELVREVAHELTPRFEAAQLRAPVHVPDACQVRSDVGKVRQILLNLIDNAVKFTKHGEVETALEEVPGNGAVILRVRDTGIGISAADQKIIFDRFRQVDGSSIRRHGGIGLGLSLVKELVALLGGTISVDSRVGAGSTFSVTLPRECATTNTGVVDARMA